MNEPNLIIEKLANRGLFCMRLLSMSKSVYRNKHPDNKVYFNANLVDKKLGKIWHGDIDITTEGNLLQEVAKECNTTLYILREHDCRFGNENDPIKEIIKRSIWNTNDNKQTL